MIKRSVSCIVLSACLLTACAVKGPPRPQVDENARLRAAGSIVEVVVNTEQVQLKVDERLGKSPSMAVGAAAGAGSCLRLGQAGPVGLALAVVCAPVGAAVGVGVTAIEQDRLETARADIAADPVSQRSRSLEVIRDESRLLLRQKIIDHARAVGLQAMDGTPEEPAGHVLEITLDEVLLKFLELEENKFIFVQLTASTRLQDRVSGKLVDEFQFKQGMSFRRIEDWYTGGIDDVVRDLDAALVGIAENAIEESMLIDKSRDALAFTEKIGATPLADADEESYRQTAKWVPPTMLRPLAPSVRRDAADSQPWVMASGGLVAKAKVESVSPTLKWGVFPRALGGKPTQIDGMQVTNVLYEVRLYDSGPRPLNLVGAGGEIFRRTELDQPEIRIPDYILKPCSIYFWTIRARFRLDGVARATEWAGAYRSSSEDNHPWWWRRAVSIPIGLTSTSWEYVRPPKSYAFPFITPPLPGQTCR